MRALFLLFSLFLTIPNTYADLRAEGPGGLSCTLYGLAGGTATDFGKLALDVYTMYTGTSTLYDEVFGKGVVAPMAVRANAGIGMAGTISNLLTAFADKNCFARGSARVQQGGAKPC
ncbi:MAG: hypothetical protein HQK50_05785 [Oligoflexia bacterium]|nr:hypothetical protein [Oligoflexia bacterium]